MMLLQAAYRAVVLPGILAILPPTPLPHATVTHAASTHITAPRHAAPKVIIDQSSGHELSMNAIIDRYESRLATFHTPQIMSFNCTVEQAGIHGLSQVHRIYRSGRLVRDETIASGGTRMKPRIRIFRNRVNAYALEALAPRRASSRFVAMGTQRDGDHLDYIFQTRPVTRQAGFVVDQVAIDGIAFLPTSLHFSANGASTASGRGVLTYGLVSSNWIILDAQAAAQIGKQTMREHLSFTDYRFPRNLPSSTFGKS